MILRRTVTRKYHFSSSHRLKDHGKCKRLHGHNYELEVTLEYVGRSDLVDTSGMVMDFAMMDTHIDPIVAMLDHRYIVSQEDKVVEVEETEMDEYVELPIRRSTAEYIAEWIFVELQGTLELQGISKVKVKEIVLWENHKSRASVSV